MKKEVNVKRYKAKVGDILIDENLKAYFIVTDDESEFDPLYYLMNVQTFRIAGCYESVEELLEENEFKELIQREDFQLLIRKAEM